MRFDSILLAAAVITKVAADGVSFAFEAFLCSKRKLVLGCSTKRQNQQ
jgi:hypothetical protein